MFVTIGKASIVLITALIFEEVLVCTTEEMVCKASPLKSFRAEVNEDQE